MGSAAIPFVPTYAVSVINVIVAGCKPGEHESSDEVSFDFLSVFFNDWQMDFDGLPIFIHKAKNHVTGTNIDEYHCGIYFSHLTRNLIVDGFASQTRRIRVARIARYIQKLKRER
jgi:hypothetical protein